ncbi:MAG: serine hydrolase [Dysgonamonadaceae bacterium]|jgi:beta-glucosidase-like glycosyl hydrolase/CubicO group peptidase (beta-lactamase class C family)|nr:serine hydrolase [Dysgonamonadaceae bacterium]
MLKLKHFDILLLFLIIFVSLQAQNQPVIFQRADAGKMKVWVDSVFDSMTVDEKIGQMFMITISPDKAYNNNVLQYISKQKIGGILFSKGNIDDEAESINLYQKNSKIPLFIALDGEWGLSMRIDGTPRFPKNMMLGAVQNLDLLRKYGSEVGRECRELGIHVNFAPVVDVNSNPRNPVIGIRSFGENPQDVANRAIIYSEGLESQNIISTAKHFPGHGDTFEDSHETLPTVGKNRKSLDSVELYPFRGYINAGFSGIMVGHLNIPAIDGISGVPTSLSPVAVNDLLKNEMGFNGLTFTDALAMKGASKAVSQSVCVEAIKAGNDILLNPTNPVTEFISVKKAVETGEIPISLIEEKCIKILQYKFAAGLNNITPVERKGLSQRINTNHAQWLVQKLNNEAVTLLKNEKQTIPLKELKRIAIISFSTESKTYFQKSLALYGEIATFNLSPSAQTETIEKIFQKLKKFDIIICGIHSSKQSNLPALQALAKGKELHLCFFTTPYSMIKFKQTIHSANSVIMAYENTKGAQQAAAELIMGGIPALGKLPVTVKGLFEYGSGLTTEKARLSYQSPIEENLSPDSLTAIDEIVNEGIKNRAFPGCQILVAKNSTVVYHKTFGAFDYAGTHNVEKEDIYDLASITKALATLPAVMKLYDTKKIGLQDKIGKYVSALENTDKEDITIRSLLFHESRLPAFLPFYQLLIDKDSYNGNLFSPRRNLTFNIVYDSDSYARSDFRFFPEMVSESPKKGIEKEVADGFYIKTDFEKDVLLEIANATLRKKNGYLYSDLNFILLKEAVENIAGQTLDNFVDTEFYQKIGAGRTTFKPLKKFDKSHIAPTEHDQFWRNQILIGYPHDEAAAVMGGVSGNAGLFSNANDLAKILQMLLWKGNYGRETFFSEATVHLFTETKSPNSRRGLGFDKPDMDKADHGSAPASTFGHTGYTGTCFWVDPDNQLIYIFLSNRVYPSRTYRQLSNMKIRERILETIYKAFDSPQVNGSL